MASYPNTVHTAKECFSSDKTLLEMVNACSAWSLHAVGARTDVHAQPWPAHNAIAQLVTTLESLAPHAPSAASEHNANRRAAKKHNGNNNHSSSSTGRSNVIVQVNGKVRAQCHTPQPEMSDELLVDLALEEASVRRALQASAGDYDESALRAHLLQHSLIIRKKNHSGFVVNLQTPKPE